MITTLPRAACSDGANRARDREIVQTRKAIYSFCRRLASRVLARGQIRRFLNLALEPLNYWRNIEAPAVINALDLASTDQVLDIGSPKIPALFIWHTSNCIVHATDLFDYFLSEYELYVSCLNTAPRPNFVMEVQDARRLSYPNERFDKVYSISVLEHIAGEGDTVAIREMGRVLKPGGLCCFTVPYSEKYFETFTTRESYYIHVKDNGPVFYERHYDDESLYNRLIVPSGLRLVEIQYFGEPVFSYEHFYNRLPYALRMVLSPFSALATRLFIRNLDPTHRTSAKTAIVVLKK